MLLGGAICVEFAIAADAEGQQAMGVVRQRLADLECGCAAKVGFDQHDIRGCLEHRGGGFEWSVHHPLTWDPREGTDRAKGRAGRSPPDRRTSLPALTPDQGVMH